MIEPHDKHARPSYEKLHPKDLHLQEILFVGFIEKRPVTIGIVFISTFSCGIFSLITKNEEQRKGYGKERLSFLLRFAKNQRCRYATLSASSNAGYQLYKRLGFHPVGTFECFEYKGDLKFFPPL